MFRNEKKRAERRGWPIHGYVGGNGAGKSAAMVWDTLPSLEAGRPVLGTVRLLDYQNPRECTDEACEADPLSGHYIRGLPEPHIIEAAFAVEPDPRKRIELLRTLGDIVAVHQVAHPLWIPLVDWQQVLDARGVDLLLDEVTGVVSSRESMSLPAAVANRIVQLRRNDVVVRWSSPGWGRADKILRECTQAVTYARGHFPKAAEVEGAARQHRQRRLFRWKTYDAMVFEDFTAGKREELDPLLKDWHWGPGSPAFAAYDTYDSVLTVGTVSDVGTCYVCGGGRMRPGCTCPDYLATRPRRGRAPAGPSEAARRGDPATGSHEAHDHAHHLRGDDP